MRVGFWLGNLKEEPRGRSMRRWEGKTEVDIEEIGWGRGMVLSGSGYGYIAGCCEHSSGPSHLINFGEFL